MLEKISRHIMLYSCSTANIGLMDGKMGVVIYFYYLARYTRNRIYSDFAKELLKQLYEIININHTTCFGDGLSGIAWGIDFLMFNKFIYADSDDVLEDLDTQILKIDLDNINNSGLQYGLEGYAYYVMSRYTNNEFRKKRKYNDFVNDLLTKIKNLENIDKVTMFVFLARRDGCSRPLPHGAPRAMSICVKRHKCNKLKINFMNSYS